jgi:hypothetical protein
MEDILGISRETEHALRFFCLTPSGRGTVIKNIGFTGRFYSKKWLVD